MSKDYYFVIVGHNDQPVFEIEFPIVDPKKKREQDVRHLNQLVAHAALDIIDEHIIQSQQMYFKVRIWEFLFLEFLVLLSKLFLFRQSINLMNGSFRHL